MKSNRIYETLKDFALIHMAQWLTPKKDRNLPTDIYQPRKFLKISFCTTCMNRTFHLKKTYLKNIIENQEYPNLEFVLVNYNSQDDMDEWVRTHLKQYIESGLVKYCKTTDPQWFHISKAKNLAHRLATGDILVSLDADNFLGKDNAFFTNHCFTTHGPNIFLRFTKKDFRFFDTAGRIALRKEDFSRVGGYREDLLPFGEEDLDFVRRLKASGIQLLNIEIINFLRTIKHNNGLRKSNLADTASLDVKQMRLLNHEKTQKDFEKNIRANKEGFTKFNVYENFNREARII